MTQFKVGKTGETESQFRQWLGQMVTQRSFRTARNGVFGGTGLGVSQTTTASGSVSVDAGMGFVQDTTLGGGFPLINDTAITLNVFGPNPLGGLPRNDIVVFDSVDETIKVLYGAANAVPTDPTIPSTVLALARLRHNPSVSTTTIPTSQIDNLRIWTVARGGITPVLDQADRDTILARAGTAVYRQDTDNLEIYDGATWDVFSPASVQPKPGRATVTVNATGYATITHGAGFKPSQIMAQPEFAYSIGVDQDLTTSTTFQVRLLNNGVAVTGPTKVSYVCYP